MMLYQDVDTWRAKNKDASEEFMGKLGLRQLAK
jgi:hypothetical protein